MTQPEIPMAAIMTAIISSKLNCFIFVFLQETLVVSKTHALCQCGSRTSLARESLCDRPVVSATLATATNLRPRNRSTHIAATISTLADRVTRQPCGLISFLMIGQLTPIALAWHNACPPNSKQARIHLIILATDQDGEFNDDGT